MKKRVEVRVGIILLALSLFSGNAHGQTKQPAVAPQTLEPWGYLKELRSENRLPEWANYVCYVDIEDLKSGYFMVIAYQSAANDPVFPNDGKDADKFGYIRSLTYQEYMGSDTGITAMNMPITPAEYADSEEMSKVVESGTISWKALELMTAQVIALNNEVAIAKSAVQSAAKYPSMENSLIKDKETDALLDAPDGTLFQEFLDKHPGYAMKMFYEQKYIDAGLINLPGGYKAYNEGNMIYEKNFGSEIFESIHSDGKIGNNHKSEKDGLRTRIQMENTASGLRFMESHTMGVSSVGIPIDGKCDPISKP